MKALFIVEPTFLKNNAYTNKIILYYAKIIIDNGGHVVFGTPQKNKIVLGNYSESSETLTEISKPYWSSHCAHNDDDISPIVNKISKMIWTDTEIDPYEYTINVITTPLICHSKLPPIPNTIGIVHDLFDNLIASGIIRSPLLNFHDHLKLAHMNNVGFCYYLANASKIIFTTEAVKSQFLSFYRTAKNTQNLITHLPYSSSDINILSQKKRKNILLYNTSDLTKFIDKIEPIIKTASKQTQLHLQVIGDEEGSSSKIMIFLKRMATLGIRTSWWRHTDDLTRAHLYHHASLLIYLSFRAENIFHMLESQEYGTPVITNNALSCQELNFNPDLCFDFNHTDKICNALVSILNDTSHYLTGIHLKNAMAPLLTSNKMRQYELYS